MIFTSGQFLLFFITFFVFYWFIVNKNLKLQNVLLLAGSYVFYAWADWRLLSYLVGASFINFFLGIYIENAQTRRLRTLLIIAGLVQGIGGLLYFKYFNFFISSFNDVFYTIGFNTSLKTLHIILPIGISFFTFKTISYILDVDKGKITATKDWVVFFNYVSFFPTILSGPIDRARDFVPQLQKSRSFDYGSMVDGMRQILWGMFKKIVIADNLVAYTNQIFNNYESFSGSTLLLGALLYTIQLYTDFSGYSDMAIGIGRLLGFKVTKNFDFPFFAQNIAEFWRKWHISLTSWLTEYVFTPLSISFRDYGKTGLILAILINFTLIGMWHGANWTYVLFGFVHGCYYIPLIIRGTMNKRKKITKNRIFPTFRESSNILLTFLLVMLANILFRSETVGDAWGYYKSILSNAPFSALSPNLNVLEINSKFIVVITLSIAMLIVGWFQRNKEHVLIFKGDERSWFRWSVYYVLLIFIIYLWGNQQVFIYFQF